MNRQEYAAKFEEIAKAISDWVGLHKCTAACIACFVAGMIVGLIL